MRFERLSRDALQRTISYNRVSTTMHCKVYRRFTHESSLNFVEASDQARISATRPESLVYEALRKGTLYLSSVNNHRCSNIDNTSSVAQKKKLSRMHFSRPNKIANASREKRIYWERNLTRDRRYHLRYCKRFLIRLISLVNCAVRVTCQKAYDRSACYAYH